jgi:Ca2+/Na+ antiporter
MNGRILGIIGAVILLIGLFVPLSRSFAADTATIIDYEAYSLFNFLRGGSLSGIVYLLLIIGSAILAFTKLRRLLIVTGALTLGLTVYVLLIIKSHIEEEAGMVATSPENARLLIDTGWHSWGWLVLVLGGIVLIVAGLLKDKTSDTSLENPETPASAA